MKGVNMDQYIQPDFSSCALITIDTQQDVLDGQPVEIPGTSAILPQMRKILDLFREKQKPVVHIIRIYKKDGSNVDLCRKQAVIGGANMFLENSSGCELAPLLQIGSESKLNHSQLLDGQVQSLSLNEVVIYKSRWGAFYKTPLESHLKRLGISTLIFIGCNFPNCPRTSIYEASERDFKVVLVEDALSGLYEQGKKELRNIGVQVLTTDELIGVIR